MRLFLLITAALVPAAPAMAYDCHDRVAAMFDGGPLDPFQRPPHSYANTVTGTDGVVQYVFDVWWQTPVRAISGMRGGALYTLMVGSDTWTGPSAKGPWTEMMNQLPEDHEAYQREVVRQQQTNLKGADCAGLVEIDGHTLDKVSFYTQTDPTGDMGSWFGASNTVYVDPETGQVARWDMTGFTNSFSQTVTLDNHVLIFTYDPSIRIEAPQ
ncbi:hypothetical protein [Tropicibacter oceani]|uniref:Uncharacterized protein n=1 Tax=Tropicibacter oceani TaxID=3058420 RepID=A0ABY8QJW1_9RHOB|nr:hypothetical protein [Tropicibacter oceani]WGW04905.1 hypothetical protein QF118_04985 [Tropicibacter oceani]